MAFIKNIEHETVLPLAEQVTVQPGQIVSRTLAQNKAVSVTLFAFDKGEEISTHDSTGDAMVQVLEGKGKFTVGGKEHFCCAGDVLIMPAKVPHAVYAEESFKNAVDCCISNRTGVKIWSPQKRNDQGISLQAL